MVEEDVTILIADTKFRVGIQQPAPTDQAVNQEIWHRSKTGAPVGVDHARTIGLEMVVETEVVVIVLAIVVQDVAEGPVSADTDDEGVSDLPVETALHDADDIAITVFVEVVMEIPIRIAGPVPIQRAAPVIDVDVRPTDTATSAEIETCPAADRRRLRHHVRCKGRGADRPKGG